MLLSLLIRPELRLSFLLIDIVLIDEYLFEEIFLGAIFHFLQYLFPGFEDDQVSELPPNGVVSLIGEARNLSNLLPGVIVLLHSIEQAGFKGWGPKILTDSGVYDVAVSLSHLQLTFYLHFLSDLRPSFKAVVLQKDDQHYRLSDCPASSLHLWIDPILKLIIDLLKGAGFYKLTDFFPIISIHSMFLDDEFLLSEGVGPFGGLHLAMIQPSFIDL